MKLNEFYAGSADEELLKSLLQENKIIDEEELNKAMNKAGLVQKEVQVRGKNGQTFTRKQWVKASEDVVQPKQTGSPMKISEDNFPKGSTIYYNGKKATVLRVGKEFSGGGMGIVVRFSNGGTGTIGKSDMKKVSKTPSESVNKKDVKPVNKDSKKEDMKSTESKNFSPHQVGANNVSAYVNRKKYGDKNWFNNIGAVLAGKEKEFESSTGKKEAIRACKEAIRSHKRGIKDSNYRDSSYTKEHSQKLVDAETKLLSILENTPVKGEQPNKDNNTSKKFNPSSFGFRAGGKATTDMMNELHEKIGVKSYKNGMVGNGTAVLENGESVSFRLDKDDKPYLLWQGQKFSASELVDKWGKSSDSKDSKQSFELPKDKSGLAKLLESGTSRDDIMSAAKSAGVTWKHSDHPGINWMRASMAITGTTTRGEKSTPKKSDSKKDVKNSEKFENGEIDKDGNFIVDDKADLEDLVSEVTGTKMFDQYDYAISHLEKEYPGEYPKANIEEMGFNSAKRNKDGSISVSANISGYYGDDEDNFDMNITFDIPAKKSKKIEVKTTNFGGKYEPYSWMTKEENDKLSKIPKYLDKPVDEWDDYSITQGNYHENFSSISELKSALKYRGLPESLANFNTNKFKSEDEYIQNDYRNAGVFAYPQINPEWDKAYDEASKASRSRRNK